jgi:hypothetical protein
MAEAKEAKRSRDGNILGDTDKETVGCSVMISYSRKGIPFSHSIHIMTHQKYQIQSKSTVFN